jgi:hypothetical protein
MASPINTSSFAKTLLPGVNAWYGEAYKEYPTEWDKLFDKHTSRRNFEEDVGVTSFGLAVVKPEGSPITYDTERLGFTTRYSHVVYALGFIITREIMEDDLYDIVGKRRAQGLAFSMRQTKEIVAANVYNRAFAGSGQLGGDGKTLLANDHPNITGGSWSNILATASDLSEAALEQSTIDIQGFTNDRGLKISVVPEQIIITPSQEFELARILKTVGRVGTDLNDINALKELGKFKKGMIVNHYLTDADAWFIRTNVPHGMKYFERRGMEFGTDDDFETENAKFKASERYSFGFTDPKCMFGSAGA